MASGTLFTHGPANVDSLLATTRSVMAKSKEFLNDAIFNKIVLLKYLKDKALVTRQGGASILIPLMYAKNGTFKAYSGDDVIDTTGVEGLTLGQGPWRNYGGTIMYAGDEIRMNGGEGKMKDLAKAKTMQSVMSAKDALNIDLFASTQGSKKVSALPVLVDATSTVHDINSTTSSWWQAQVVASGSFAARTLADLRNIRNLIARAGQDGASQPDIYITTQLVTELYEASLLPSLRYADTRMADGSFKSVEFSGAPMVFDPNVATGELYALSSEALEFVVHEEAQWTVGNFIEPADQDVRVAKVLWMGNLITKNRRRLGKLTGITA